MDKFKTRIGLAAGDYHRETAVSGDDALWERACAKTPDTIVTATRRFIEAGAEVVVAFTDRLGSISLRGVMETTAAAGAPDAGALNRTIIEAIVTAAEAHPDVAVLAALGPVEPLLMLEEITPEELEAAYAEQVQVCCDAGVGGFLCRSFSELDALACAVRAIRGVCDLPIIGSMAFDAGPDAIETTTGTTVAQAHTMLTQLGASMVGVDRGEFPDGAAAIVSLMRESGPLPIYAEINAGRAEIVEQRVVYPEPAAAFGERLERLADAGARIVGGGHGAGAGHVAHLARLRERLVRRSSRRKDSSGESE